MDKKISELIESTSLVLTDLFAVVTGIGGTPQTKKIQWSTIFNIILGRNPLHGVTSRPIGASNPLPTAITTTTFTLGATANPISYYYQGTKIDVTTDKTCTLSAGAGLYWIYFDGATGNIAASKSYPGFGSASNVTIATVLWNGTDYGLVSDERHSHTRNKDWHTWAHDSIGCRYVSGLTLTHNGGTGAAATFATTAGEIADEDIKYAIDASSAFPTANAGRLFWQESASAYTFDKTPSTVPFKRGANNRPVYVRSDTYAVVEMTSAGNRYINVFVYATTDLHTPISFVTETVSPTVASNNGYNNLSDARAVPFPNLAGLSTRQEVKPIYRLIVRADGVLQAIDTAQDDYRTVSSLPFGAGTVSTTASAVTFAPYGNISSANVQSAVQELEDEKISKTSPILEGELDCQAHSIGFTQQTATGDGTTTIDWKNGNKAYFTFGNANETFTFTNPSKPCNLLLVLKQYSTGGKTATWPNSVMWPGGTAPTLSTGNNAIDIVSMYFNGTNYFAVASLNFAVPA